MHATCPVGHCLCGKTSAEKCRRTAKRADERRGRHGIPRCCPWRNGHLRCNAWSVFENPQKAIPASFAPLWRCAFFTETGGKSPCNCGFFLFPMHSGEKTAFPAHTGINSCVRPRRNASGVFLPEGNGLVDPAFGHGAGTQAKAMRQAGVMMKLRGNTQRAEGLNAPLHGAPTGDAVALADTGEGGRVVLCIIGMASVLHDDRRRARIIALAKSRRAVGTQPCRHARAR